MCGDGFLTGEARRGCGGGRRGEDGRAPAPRGVGDRRRGVEDTEEKEWSGEGEEESKRGDGLGRSRWALVQPSWAVRIGLSRSFHGLPHLNLQLQGHRLELEQITL